ncbi:hypothetical protein ACLI1A_17615 [Flavobacterium sp. RHBU_3]|uniref:hypothetical protein n=1 Tax=Flavobacterium sp. RHBU_3 TaxID=3391184 RepID=UPI00398523DE
MDNLNTTTILQTLFTSLFMGFGILIPLFSVIKTSNLKGIHFKELFILQGVQAIRLAGILNLILQMPLMYKLYTLQQPQDNGVQVSIQGGNLENYGWVIFYGPVLYFVLSQLFWVKKLYMHKVLLIVFSLIVFVLPSQWMLDFFVSLKYTHYKSFHKATEFGSFGLQALLSIVVFFFTTFMLMQFTGKMKKVVQ